MRKILCCLLIIAAALIVMSCSGKDDKELASINPGLYEINFDLKYGGQLVIFKQRVRYKADGTYEATNFQNNAAVEELKGKYKVENKQLVSFDTQHRLIIQEGTWIKKSESRVNVRNIAKGSYEYYFQYPTTQTREQYKGLGLSEGWKTYKRISD
jgi:phosphosulfolactate synthase (CoM biosynthesis protein A)